MPKSLVSGSNINASKSLFASSYSTLQAAFTAFQSSTADVLVLESGATYSVSATQTLDALVGKTVEGNGATIHMTGAGTVYGIRFTGVWSNSTVRNLNFTTDGSGTKIGIVWDSSVVNTTVENCGFTNLFQGISYSGAGGSSGGNRIHGCFITGSTNAGIYCNGEYLVVSDCIINNNDEYGIQIAGGNNSVLGNTITYNNVGILVDSNGVANGDHGVISDNFINHNNKCGVYLKDLVYGMVVSNNQIAATNGANLGAGVQASSFGVYIKAGTGVQLIGNDFLRNKFSLGIEGIAKSLIQGNVFVGDNTLTTNHISELGGTNQTTLITENVVGNDLTGAAIPIIATGSSLQSNTLAGALNEFGRVTGNITNATVTPSAITGTSVTLLAGRTYAGTLTVYCNDSVAADGSRFDFDGGTATATDFRAMGTIADTVSVRPLAMTSAIATDLVDTTTTGDAIAVINFTITVNASGTFIPRFAQEAHSTGTLTVYRGTSLVIKDITA